MKVGDLVRYRNWDAGTSPIMLVVKTEPDSSLLRKSVPYHQGGQKITVYAAIEGTSQRAHTMHSDWLEVVQGPEIIK